MGPGETFSVIALMAGIVSIVWLVTHAWRQGMEAKYRRREAPEPRVEQSDAYRQLEERVRVLERIATDRSPELASQIEALRHEPLASAQFDTKERA